MKPFLVLLAGALALSVSPVFPKDQGAALAQGSAAAPRVSADSLRLTEEMASAFARLALDCIQKEYPNKPDHVANGDDDVRSPRSLHPAFYGCFDWHSAVHGHWMLVRLLKLFPGLPEAAEVRIALNSTLSPANIASEVAYLDESNRKSFERTYGWAWLLKLAEELHGWDDPDGRRWEGSLAPLAKAIARRYADFLPKQTYPIRTGVHPNTAFGIAFALDYANAVGDGELQALLLERAVAYYGNDRDFPAEWEPGGEDFFSPCLIEADLMRRVISGKSYSEWFHAFLPGAGEGEPKCLFFPATVADRNDPKIVHLDGLNLSCAWCMAGIAAALPRDDPARLTLGESAARHARNALAHVASGSYEGEHWLASFALYMLTVLGAPE